MPQEVHHERASAQSGRVGRVIHGEFAGETCVVDSEFTGWVLVPGTKRDVWNRGFLVRYRVRGGRDPLGRWFAPPEWLMPLNPAAIFVEERGRRRESDDPCDAVRQQSHKADTGSITCTTWNRHLALA